MIPLLHQPQIYSARQKPLLKSFKAGEDLLIFFNATEKIRNHDATYPYRPDSSFLYLCGFNEPESILFLWKQEVGGKVKNYSHLLVRPRDPEREHWDGPRYGPDAAKKATGVSSVGVLSEFESFLVSWLEKIPANGVEAKIYANTRFDITHKLKLERAVSSYRANPRMGRMHVAYIADGAIHAERVRLIKDNEEIAIMQKAADINCEAHRQVMRAIKPGKFEYEMQAIAEGTAISLGARHQAYAPICASGANATILHYGANTRKMKAGELFLIDAGCEYKYYASDVTRTIPVSGKYNKAQRLIMDLVQEAHEEALHVARSGRQFQELHDAANKSLAEGLVKAKIIKAPLKKVLAENMHRKYFTHGTSHWIGMDVHDPSPVIDENQESVRLRPGMAFTIEPGLYFAHDDKSVDAQYRGIGVRIEDDIVVTHTKPKILTYNLPRYAADIEKFMAKR